MQDRTTKQAALNCLWPYHSYPLIPKPWQPPVLPETFCQLFWGASLSRKCLAVPFLAGPVGCGFGVPPPFLIIPYPCGCWRVFLSLGAVAEWTERGGGRTAVEILRPCWQLYHQLVPVHRGCAAALPLLPYPEPGPDGSGLRRVRVSPLSVCKEAVYMLGVYKGHRHLISFSS